MDKIKELYKERKEILQKNQGFVRMMVNKDTGEVWNDFFVDESSYKRYADENIIEIPVFELIMQKSDHILSDEEIVKEIERWISNL